MPIFLKITAALFFAVYLFEVSAWLGWAVLFFTAGNFWEGFVQGFKSSRGSIQETNASAFNDEGGTKVEIPGPVKKKSNDYYHYNLLVQSLGKELKTEISEILNKRYENETSTYHAKMSEISSIIKTTNQNSGLKALVAELETSLQEIEAKGALKDEYSKVVLKLNNLINR
jgi:hypothetical protein